MYVASNISKKAHFEWCSHCNKIKEENKKEYFHTDDAIDDGCVFCQHCSMVKKNFKKDKKRIEWAVTRYKLSYEMIDGMLVIDDGMSKWKIFYSTKQRRFVLYHQNYLTLPGETEESPILGYHQQNIEFKRLLEAFEYVHHHFQAYLKNFKLPKVLQNKAENIFFEERNHKRPRKKRRDVKKEKKIARNRAAKNVLALMKEIQQVN